jgi:hypothetical protein
MGSAIIEGDRKVGTDKSFGKGAVKVTRETTEGARACHSFWEAVGGMAGVTGARLSGGIAQQARPQHWQCFEPQHLRATGAADVATAAEKAKTVCQTVTTLTKTARSAVAALLSRADVNVVMFCSFRYSTAGLCQRRHWLSKISILEFSTSKHRLSHVGIRNARALL